MAAIIEFTSSTQTAINFVAGLYYGQKFVHGPDNLELPKPDWRNMVWFESVIPEKVEKRSRSNNGCTELCRKISFYGYKKNLIAEVWLQGFEHKNTDGSKPTFWRVNIIRYREYFDESRIFAKSNWFEADFANEQTPLQ